MITIIVASLICVSTILVVAYACSRKRFDDESGRDEGSIRRLLRFVSGPFSLSITLHIALLMFLIITMHEHRNRELTLLTIEPGGDGGGSTDEMRNLDVEEPPMPEIEHTSLAQPSTSSDVSASLDNAYTYVRGISGSGIGVGRGTGIGGGNGSGFGPGSFRGFIGDLRRNGLDVVLVIDGTGSMSLVIQDVKARMRDLIGAIHSLVPTARVGMVVYGGKGDTIATQPLTLLSSKLEGFLDTIRASGGDEWEENVRGGIDTAIEKMDWRSYAKKVIVLVADTPPAKEDFAPTRELVRNFRARNGTFNTIDVMALEHWRFERALEAQLHHEYASAPNRNGALPQFSRETQLAYQVLVHDGGGAVHSLDSNEQINQEVMILAFGQQWRAMIAAFQHPLASK